MKWYCPIGTVCLLAFLYACTSSVKIAEPDDTASPTLSAIDSLMWRQPDSAFALLMQFVGSPEADGLDTYNGHYCQLLISELLYKNDCEQTNRQDLQKAVAYFDSLTFTLNETPTLKSLIAGADPLSLTRNDRITFLTARAHYINGVGYYENDSIVEACAEYLKVVEIMESGFEEKELEEKKALFLAMAYTRLTVLFSDLYLHEQAIYFAKASLAYYQKQESPSWYQAWVMNEVGSHYDMMDELDSAYYYYHKASVMINDTTILLYRDITTHQAYLKYKANNQKDFALIELYHLLSEAENEKEYCSRCAIIGEIYYHEKQFDSAWVYLTTVFRNSQSIQSKRQAAEWLVEICKVQSKEYEILEYADFLIPYANQEENQSEVKSHLTEWYNAFRQAKLSMQHRQMLKKSTTQIIVIVGVLIVGLLTSVFLNHKNRKRKQLLEKQIKEEQLSHDMTQKALSGRLKQSNQRLQETLRKIESQKTEHKTIENDASFKSVDERYESFRLSPICLEIQDKINRLNSDNRNTLKINVDITAYKAFAMTLSQTVQLTKTVEMFFPNLYATLKAQYATLDRKEWLHCCLYLLQLDKMSICVLLQEPYYSCRRCTMKLEEAFDCRQGLSAFIIEQIKPC